MLRAGRWLARRYGLTGELLDPRTAVRKPAGEVVGVLLDHVADALRAAGDEEIVRDGVEMLLRDGGGAGRQRAAAGADLDLDAVAHDLLRRTLSLEDPADGQNTGLPPVTPRTVPET